VKLFTTFLFLTISLFGIIDEPLQKPVYDNSRDRLFATSVENYPSPLESNISSDDKNIFIYSEHFRVLFGTSYSSSILTREFADKILGFAEKSWEVEIGELGFQKPSGSDKYFIDIYIANRNAYNYPKSETVRVGSSYAGYASLYPDGTPYIVINPTIGEKVLQVTVAHEFFHTVQYAYFNGDDMSDAVWYDNIWFLEGTAVFMEDEVFPDNNDYISLADNYTQTAHRSLEYYNGSCEYGKSILFKFFRERYGSMEIVTDALHNIDETKRFLEVIEANRTNFHNELTEFGSWLIEPESNFHDGADYPTPTIRDMDTTYRAEKYGFLFLKDSGDYSLASNPQYGQRTFSNEEDKIVDLENGVAVVNFADSSLSTETLKKNIVQPLQIKKGWNMVGNIFEEDIDLLTHFPEDFLWIWRDGEYFGFSSDENLKRGIENISNYTDLLFSGEGAWVYSDSDRNISFQFENLAKFSETDSSSYQLRSISGSTFSPNFLGENKTIFYFDNSSQNWEIYDKGEQYGDYPLIESIDPQKGYFIKGE
jgi:hypothetical protein